MYAKHLASRDGELRTSSRWKPVPNCPVHWKRMVPGLEVPFSNAGIFFWQLHIAKQRFLNIWVTCKYYWAMKHLHWCWKPDVLPHTENLHRPGGLALVSIISSEYSSWLLHKTAYICLHHQQPMDLDKKAKSVESNREVKWRQAAVFKVEKGCMNEHRELNVLFSPQFKVPRPSGTAMAA